MKIWKNSGDAWKEIQPGIFQRILSQEEFATLALYRFKPNAGFPIHKAGSEHFGLFVQGKGSFETDKGKIAVGDGDAFFINPEEGHGFFSSSDGEAIVLEVFIPASRQHLAKAQVLQMQF